MNYEEDEFERESYDAVIQPPGLEHFAEALDEAFDEAIARVNRAHGHHIRVVRKKWPLELERMFLVIRALYSNN